MIKREYNIITGSNYFLDLDAILLFKRKIYEPFKKSKKAKRNVKN